MKKISRIVLVLTLVAAMIMMFTACKSNTDNNKGDSSSVTDAVVSQASENNEENGQNPVMNFVGKYDNGGCYITVEAVGNNEAKFTVDFPLTDDEAESYTFSGEFEEDTLSVHYSNSTKKVLTLAADGSVTDEKTEYTDGSGKILFHEDGTLDWQDENEAERLIDNTTFSFMTTQN